MKYVATNTLVAKISADEETFFQTIAEDMVSQVNQLDPEHIQISSIEFDVANKAELEGHARDVAMDNAWQKVRILPVCRI